LFSSTLLATETLIQGNVEGFEGKSLELGYYSDYITLKKSKIQESEILNGDFSFEFDLEETKQFYLKIDNKLTSLFVEPGQVYNVNLSYNATENEGRAFYQNLNLNFPFPQHNGLNQIIKRFNNEYIDFFDEYKRQIIVKGAKKETTAFIQKWEERLEDTPNQFAKNYIRYTLAQLEHISYVPEEELFNKYFRDQTPLQNHKEYMGFFQQFYRNDFEELALTKAGSEILKSIMLNSDLDACILQIKDKKQFESNELAELYLINGLFEVFHQKVVEQASSLRILNSIADNSKSDDNKIIASNVYKKLSLYSKTNEAPNFNLTNLNGESVSLRALKGKPIYLNFWAKWSNSSLSELKIIQQLKEKYGDEVHFVSINVDEDKSIVETIAKQNNYDWNFLHFNFNYDLREEYGALSIPSYYLIDENNKMLRAFARGPLEIEREIFNLTRRN